MIITIKKCIEINESDSENSIFILPSGFDGKFLKTTETPTDHVEVKYTNLEELECMGIDIDIIKMAFPWVS